MHFSGHSTPQYSILKPLKHLGLLLSDNLESYSNLMVPVAFALVDCDSLCSAAFHQPNWPPLLYPVATQKPSRVLTSVCI